MRRFVLPLRVAGLAAALALVGAGVVTPALAASAERAAPIPVRFGIGDQHPAMFTDPRWQALGLRITRLNVPWDAASDPAQLARAERFVIAARAARVEVLVHLTGRAPDGIVEPLPSRAAYRAQARALIAALRPLGVRTWGAWNEANHATQPTSHHPERAAQFFLELRAACRGCTIVAADVLTQGSARSTGVASYRGWLGRFLRALGPQRSAVRIVGIHNYGELIDAGGAARSRDLTRVVRRLVPRARFWITESGGIAASRTRPCDEARQAIGVRRMFSHAAALAPDGIDRLYAYNWTAASCNGQHDSGLIRADGSARPALGVVSAQAPRFRR